MHTQKTERDGDGDRDRCTGTILGRVGVDENKSRYGSNDR